MKLRLRIARTIPAPLAAVLGCLGLLAFAHPAHAGYYTITSTVNNNGVTSTGYSVSEGYPSSSAITYTPASGSSAPQYTMNSTVTFTVTGTWTPSFPGDTSTPPATTNFLETANTQATAESGWYGGPSGSMQPATASGDDGLGDTATVSDSTVSDVRMYISTGTGKHLVQESGNTFTITVTIKDTATGSMMVYGQAALDVSLDSRSASITSGLPPTYHQGPNDVNGVPTRVADVPVSGVMTATTVGPWDSLYADFPQVAFNGNAIGTFGAGSAYNMYSSAKSYTSSGTFSGTGLVTSFTNVYDDLSLPQEHVHLRLTDGVDGAQATANYYVNFHAPIEGWTKTTPLNFPQAFDPNNPNADPEWHEVCDIPDDTAVAPTLGATQSVTFNVAYTATVGGSVSLTPDEIATIEQNESVTLTNSVTETASGTQTFPGAPWSDIAYYAAETYTEDTGTFLAYGTDGFDGQQPWTCVNYISPIPSIASVTLATYTH